MSKKLNYNSTFRPDDDFLLNACLGYNSNEWGTISRGFRKAANNLVAHVRNQESDLDGMVYPITFLFRHAIETSLKIAIVATGTKPTKTPDHLLVKMWDRIQPNVARRFQSDPSYVNLSTVRKTIVDFESIDPLSIAFRYPTNKEGAKALPGIDVINLGVLSDNANRLLENLGRIINAFG